jgi:hypothetical protein
MTRQCRFILLIACVSCLSIMVLPAAAERSQWTYQAKTPSAAMADQREIKITITRRPNGFDVSGELIIIGLGRCPLLGQYFPGTGRLRARADCTVLGGLTGREPILVDGFKQGDGLQITAPFVAVARPVGARPQQPMTATPSAPRVPV